MNTTMKCIIKKQAGQGNLEYTTKPIPKIGDTDILVKIKAAAICGTDVHIEDWNTWAEKRVSPPVIIGHEFSGEVIEIGKKVTSIKVGNIVSAETHVVCNFCELCRNNFQHVCYNTSTIGVHRDGCFAEYIAIPEENAIVFDSSIPFEILSMMEPLGVAVHAAMEFPIASKTVAIVGCGPIGAMAVAVAKKIGARKIIAVEPNPERASLVLKMGADIIVNPLQENPIQKIKSLTNNHGVDVVLEFSGHVSALKAAFSYCKPEAKIAAVGLASKPIDFDISEFVYRGLTLKGIAGRLMYETWEQIKGFMVSGLDISPIITHVLPLESYEKGLHLMRDGKCGKVILKP